MPVDKRRNAMKHVMTLAAAAASLAASAAVPFKIGVAGYTFCRRTIDDALAIMEKADVHYLCVKDFHLPFSATDADMAAFKAKCAAHGVTPYAIGPVYVKDAAKLREQFEFARRFGVKTIVGVPYEPTDEKDTWKKRRGSRALLLEVDKLVKEFDIRYAIHNHGPASPEMFPDVEYGWNIIKDLDPRIGFCIDVGWEYGSGKDPAATIREHADRIFDAHIKNFPKGEPNGGSIPLPRGKIDLAKVFKAFADVGYDGVCSLEYEVDFEDNLLAVVESIAYERGLCDAIKAKAVMKPAPEGANTLTAGEKAEGWKLAWDGRTLDGWLAVKSGCKEPPEKGWFVKDGTLTMRPVNGIADGKWFPLPPEDQKLGGGGDIVTAKKYRDFEFKFDFRLTDSANSGVKYFYDETQNKGTCEEYQVLENGHPDSEKGRDGNRKSAALYDIYPANADGILKGPGEWNTGMVVSKGAHVEHWLNGVKVLEYDRGTPEFRAAVKASKYANWGVDANGSPQDWGEIAEGRILLQDHSDSTVSFCNLKIREL
jgi:sugar phosphate isomerase/epimerase